eukprot:gene7157-9657_t
MPRNRTCSRASNGGRLQQEISMAEMTLSDLSEKMRDIDFARRARQGCAVDRLGIGFSRTGSDRSRGHKPDHSTRLKSSLAAARSLPPGPVTSAAAGVLSGRVDRTSIGADGEHPGG